MTSSWSVSAFDSFIDLLLRLTTGGARYVFAFLSALLVALLLTPPVREMAKKMGMVDQPDERRINKVPIPRGGGIAVFITFHFVLLAFTLLDSNSISSNFSSHWQVQFFLSSSLLLIIGFVDDRFGLKAIYKLIGQIAVASWLFFAGVKFGGIIVAFPPWLDYLVTVFWIVGAINAFNLIDGMDGLSSGLSLIASLGLAGALLFNGHTADTIPYFILAGACLGFLRYNFHPASVFLGDSGSMFLGLCVATLPLVTGSRKELVASLGVPLLAMGVPIFDTMLAIWRRTARSLLPKELVGAMGQTHVMQPDKDHLHHRILKKTLNQRTAAIVLYGMSAALVLVGLVGMLLRNHAPAFFMITFMVAVTVAVRHMMSVEIWDTGRVLSKKRATLRQAIILPFYIVADIIILVIAWTTASFLAGMPLGRHAFIVQMPVVVGVIFIGLVVSKTYRRVWSRAQIRDFVVLTFTLLTATILAVSLVMLIENHAYGVMRFTVSMFVCAFFPIVGLRVMRECLTGILHSIECLVITDNADTDKILAMGGGAKFRLFLKELISQAGHNKKVIVGLLDDDINLRGRVISGYKVLDGFDCILEHVKKTRADRVIITCELPREKEQEIAAILKAEGIAISAWRCSEEKL